MKTLLEEAKIARTVREMKRSSFTVLEFIERFRKLYPEEWERLVKRFGRFGEKRRYTVNTYLSNRLDVYSHKGYSLLVPFRRYKEARFTDYRGTREDEKRSFGSQWIAVFRKKD
ncbi:hypothetical protein AMJ40_00915 [candidate division TA06 bacterium DG_26]|uniref:Uncharacterized protein n=1 Tax=candidate division TA06 bacterium DG_26 TaxID=1703771 RepID=A0A0S7WLQ5_UNCT6|nr:MAG: hypothetical protein AMJ40_00915 [candidate division TA06 bacterium DG_26]